MNFLSKIGLSTTWLCVLAVAGQAADQLSVGYLPVTGHAKFFIAQEQGIFAQEGLEVKLVEFTNSADGLSAVRADKLDIGAFGTTAPLVHISKGAELRIIGGIMGEDAALITTADKATGIRTIADLKGKKVATVRLATGDAVLRGALAKIGIDWRKDLEISELKNPPAVIEAVKGGQVDAGVVWGPHDARAEEQGLKIVVRSNALAPGHPCCRIVVQTKTLEGRKEVLDRFLRSILKAERFAREHHPETIAAIGKYVKLDPALIEKTYYTDHLDQSSDPNKAGIDQFWTTLKDSKFVESDIEIGRFIDGSRYLAALDSLARQEPGVAFWAELKTAYPARN